MIRATVTLTALNGNIFPSERVLVLDTSYNIMVPVGRASKSIAKGLFSAADNAWFDSPVMSRQHAQLKMDSENNAISIVDIGSMHGTYQNDVELPRDTPTIINSGDILVFGAEVRRGPEIFPACGFSVNVEYLEIKPTNTFAFPEPSDSGGSVEEDCDFSEDDHGVANSRDDNNFQSSAPNASRDNAIDLTGIETLNMRTNVIDLTDEMEPPVAHSNGQASVPGLSRSIGRAFDTESEDGDAGFSSDSSGHSNLVSDDSGDSENGDEHTDEALGSMSEDSEAMSDIDSEDMEVNGKTATHLKDAYIVDNSSDEEEVEEDLVREELSRFTHADMEKPPILLSDIRTRTQLPGSIADEEEIPEDAGDKESSFGLSEAGEAGLRALFEGSLLDNEIGVSSPSEPEPELESEPEHQVEVMEWSDDDFEHPAPSSKMEPILPPMKLPSHAAVYSTLQNFTGHKLGITSTNARQPSPSDAAMVKTAIPSTNEHSLVGALRECGALDKSNCPQSLGEKTGKNAFFEAREVNKAQLSENIRNSKINFSNTIGYAATDTSSCISSPFKPMRAHMADPPISPVPSMPTSAPGFTYVESGSSSGFGRNSTASQMFDSKFAIREPCTFLDNPDSKPFLARAPSPQLDMTSAYSFNMSKTAPQSNSRGIKINDIIDISTTPQRTMKLKRKAEDVSDATDQELRMWAEASSSDTRKTHGESNLSIETKAANGDKALQPVSANPTGVEIRPTKRMRKFLENVGYVALGGVTVGAGLFTVLVATAPDFL